MQIIAYLTEALHDKPLAKLQYQLSNLRARLVSHQTVAKSHAAKIRHLVRYDDIYVEIHTVIAQLCIV